MEQLRTFPLFPALPAEIRREIWMLAGKAIFKAIYKRDWGVHYLHYLHLSRERVDPEQEEKARTEEISAMILRHQGWDQLTDAERAQRLSSTSDDARRRYRATLVKLAPLTGPSVCWQLNELAATCTDALECIQPLLKAVDKWRVIGRDVPAMVKYRSDIICLAGPEVPAMVKYRSDIICLAGPEKDTRLPFFMAADTEVVNFGGPTQQERQVITVPDVEAWQNKEDIVPNHCPTITQAFHSLKWLQRVAFVFNHTETFHTNIGLEGLYGWNLLSLEEIYIIDKSIALLKDRDGRYKTPRALPAYLCTPSTFAGPGGKYHVVQPTDTDVWNIRTAEGTLLPVFECATAIAETLSPSTHRMRVWVLAFVPHQASVVE